MNMKILKTKLRHTGFSLLADATVLFSAIAPAQAADKKPKIVVIMSDDVGMWNISAYHHGMMGGRTANIDRIASEGALFTNYYAQQSCTAGRAALPPILSLHAGGLVQRCSPDAWKQNEQP